jgi:uncharacterized glyoxalase superfamily protein PhnB
MIKPMSTKLVKTIPVLESADIARDVAWYKEKTGFEISFSHEKMYAGLYREELEIHLQWHAGTKDDPMSGGAVIRIDVKNIKPLFEEFKLRGTVQEKDLKKNTPWGTNEFAFADPNSNVIIISEDIE